MYGICDGVMGLIAGRLKQMDWPSVTGWVAQGGAYLGTKRTPPTEEQLPQIANKLKEFGIQALLIIGGFEVSRYLNIYLEYPVIEIPVSMIGCIFCAGISNWSDVLQRKR